MRRRRFWMLGLLVIGATAAGFGLRSAWEAYKRSIPLTARQLLGIAPDEFAAWKPTKPITIVSIGLTLETVLADLSQQLGEPVAGDWDVLEPLGIERTSTLYLDRRHEPAHEVMSAIERMNWETAVFDRTDKGWVLTDPSLPTRKKYTREYDLRWMIQPIVERSRANASASSPGIGQRIAELLGLSSSAPAVSLFEEEDVSPSAEEALAVLGDIVRDHVDSDNWLNAGGMLHSMSEFQGIVTITTTGQRHREIADLLYRIYLADRFGIDDTPRIETEAAEFAAIQRRLDRPILIPDKSLGADSLNRALREQAEITLEFNGDGQMTEDKALTGREVVTEGAAGDVALAAIRAATRRDIERAAMLDATDRRGHIRLAPDGEPDKTTPKAVRVYGIGDLATLDPAIGYDSGAAWEMSTASLVQGIADLVRDTHDPDGWRSAGGFRSYMSEFGTALIIEADLPTHTAVADRLSRLRAARFRADGP